MKKIKVFLLVLIMLITAIPISSTTSVEAASKKVSLSKTSITMNIGQTKTIKLKNNTSKVTWSVSNAKIKIVSKSKTQVKIQAVKSGSATIKAKVGSKTYKCRVTINKSYLDTASKTMQEGDSTVIRLVNNAAAVTWSASNSNIKIISSNKKQAKIKAVRAGTSVLKAKVGTKTYKCTITVNKTFSATSDDIGYDMYVTDSEVIGIFKNNSSETVSLDAKVIYYDAGGNILDYSINFNYSFGAGKECALEFIYPYDTNYNKVSFYRYEVIISVQEPYYEDYTGGITVSPNKGTDGIKAMVTNQSGQNLDTIQLAVVYYDENHNVIGYDYTYADCKSAGSTDVVSFFYPYDSDYHTIIPADYKVYVNHAYIY